MRHLVILICMAVLLFTLLITSFFRLLFVEERPNY